MGAQKKELIFKIVMYLVKSIVLLLVLRLIYLIYLETGILTAITIFLILVELYGKRQIERSILKLRKNKKDE